MHQDFIWLRLSLDPGLINHGDYLGGLFATPPGHLVAFDWELPVPREREDNLLLSRGIPCLGCGQLRTGRLCDASGRISENWHGVWVLLES